MRQNTSWILIFYILVLSASCNKDIGNENLPTNWDEIEIYTRNQKVSILNESDTANFEIKKYSEDDKKYEIEKKSFTLNKTQKDSVYKLVYKMITKPVFTDKNATCFAGYCLIRLTDRNTSLSCQYRSVGMWSEVSPETLKLYKILKKKIEISAQ